VEGGVVTLGEPTFGQTVAAGAINTTLTALLVGGVAAYLVKRYENRAAERRRRDEELHDQRMQDQQLEYQTRATLRETYARLLVAQRTSRQASLRLGEEVASAQQSPSKEAAVAAHDEFIDLYHRLNLDVDDEMWREARSLRKILDDLLAAALRGEVEKCRLLIDTARDARQNLERSFRIRLGYTPLQKRRCLGKYDKAKS
jgi:hypothetical protein